MVEDFFVLVDALEQAAGDERLQAAVGVAAILGDEAGNAGKLEGAAENYGV